MKNFIKILILLSAINVAYADLPFQPKFTWTPPVEYTNGSTLNPATDLKSFKLYCPGMSAIDIQNVGMPPYEYIAPVGQFAAGDYSCAMTAVDNNLLESAQSTSVNFTVPVANPTPVTGLTVQ